MKKKPASPKPADPLLSRQWRSESTTASGEPAPQADGSASATGNPPPPPCKITIDVYPDAVCCTQECCPASFDGVAEGSADCEISVTLPDGTTVSGTGVVGFSYNVRAEDCGQLLTFSASGSKNGKPCKGASKKVYVFDVRFKFTFSDDFKPKVLPANQLTVGFTRVDVGWPEEPKWPKPYVNKVRVPAKMDKSQFSLMGRAGIYVVPDPSKLSNSIKAIADACCAKWKLRITQAVVANKNIEIGQTNADANLLKILPCLDGGTTAAAKDFSKSGERITLNTDDSPGSTARLDKQPVYQALDLLTNMEIMIEFYSWLFAEHKECPIRKPLAWVKWRCDYNVDFTVSSTGTPAPTATWKDRILEIEGKGEGEGPHAIVLSPKLQWDPIPFPSNNIPAWVDQHEPFP